MATSMRRDSSDYNTARGLSILQHSVSQHRTGRAEGHPRGKRLPAVRSIVPPVEACEGAHSKQPLGAASVTLGPIIISDAITNSTFSAMPMRQWLSHLPSRTMRTTTRQATTGWPTMGRSRSAPHLLLNVVIIVRIVLTSHLCAVKLAHDVGLLIHRSCLHLYQGEWA